MYDLNNGFQKFHSITNVLLCDKHDHSMLQKSACQRAKIWNIHNGNYWLHVEECQQICHTSQWETTEGQDKISHLWVFRYQWITHGFYFVLLHENDLGGFQTEFPSKKLRQHYRNYFTSRKSGSNLEARPVLQKWARKIYIREIFNLWDYVYNWFHGKSVHFSEIGDNISMPHDAAWLSIWHPNMFIEHW